MRLKTLWLSFLVAIIGAVTGLAQEGVGHEFGPLPLVFELNQGQAAPDVRFLARTGAITALLGPSRTLLLLPQSNRRTASRVITLDLMGGNRSATAEGVGLLAGRSNYFIGRDPSKWYTGIPQFARVIFKSVFPETDVIYYGNEGTVEYDFVLRPGADPHALAFRISGSSSLRLNDDGDIVVAIGNDEFLLRRPSVYQERRGWRQAVTAEYALQNGNEVTIKVGAYDRHRQLVVDPVLSYSTLIGANNSATVQGMAVDSSGDVYITGTTSATNYPTVNAFQSSNAGYDDVFVTKLNPTGDQILYSTYLGSSGFDSGRAIAVDAQGNAYVTGNIGGPDFPTTPGAFMTTCPGICNTPFVTKFLNDGTLSYSTFMGGSNIAASAIAVDSAGAAYITGTAASTDLPLVNAFQSTPAGGFVQKLDPTGSGLDYSTYLGGGADSGLGIAVDSAGSPYVVGDTSATNFPLKNPIQLSLIGGPNAFITKFSPDGSSLVFSTYLGGTSPYFFSYEGDYAKGVAVDSSGTVHIVGTSSSCEFPLTLGALNTDCVNVGYDQKVFVLALNPAGSQLLFSTFLRSGTASGIAVDAKGNSYVSGTTIAQNFPVLNPIESTSQRSNSTGFVSELDLTGKLKFSTYLGATSGGSQAAGIAVDAKGGIYVAGGAQGDFPLLNPIPSQILQSTYYTLFISKISPKSVPQFSLSPRVSPTLALRNVSSVPLTITSITSSSNFTEGGSCSSSLAAGAGCTLILEGADDHKKTGSVTITSNAYKNPQTFVISKASTGDTVSSVFAIFPLYVTFAPQLIGTTSGAQQIVIQNLGLQPGAINSITVIPSSPFTQTNDCPAELNQGSTCTISVTYTAATAQDSAAIDIVHDPNQTQDTVFLSGVGASSAIVASTPAVGFGSQLVGMAPLPRIVNLANTTPYSATVTGISASTGFVQTNTCTKPLPPQASCRVAVSYQPTTNQNAAGTLTATNYGPGGGATVSLSATGLINGDLTVSPIEVDFPPTVLNTTFNASPVTLANVSSSLISITSIQALAPFSQTNTCGSSLGVGASCQITVAFTPTQLGSFTGTVSVAFSGSGSPQSINLTGTGTTILSFTPSPVVFGQQEVGTQSPQTYLSVDNSSSQSITLKSVTIQGSEFSIAQNACPTTLKPFTGCALQLVFTPSATGLRTGTVSLSASDYSQPHMISLQGTGIGAGQLTLSATSLQFAPQKVGTTSAAQMVMVTNTGSAPINFSGITSSATFFPTSNTCGGSLSAGASCTISVQFAPTLKGILAGTLTIDDDAAGNPHTFALSGVGD